MSRDALVQVRVSREEKAQIEGLAEAVGLKVPDYARRKMLGVGSHPAKEEVRGDALPGRPATPAATVPAGPTGETEEQFVGRRSRQLALRYPTKVAQRMARDEWKAQQ